MQIRDPVSRFISRYRFNREILPKMKDRTLLREARNRSENINQCVLDGHIECDYTGTLDRWHKQFQMDSQIPFLCGDSEICRTMGHPEAVEATIRNIDNNYLVVGVLEMLEETVTVLECLMPDVMQGLVEAFRTSEVHKKSQHAAMAAAVMREEVRDVMRERLEPEYSVYQYVRQRLARQYTQCLTK